MTTSCARSLAPSSGVDARPAWRRPGPQTGTARPNLDKPTRPRAMLTALGGRHDATSPPDPDALHSCSRHSCGANRWNGEGTPISTRDKSTAPGCSSSHGRRDPPALDCRPPRQAATAGRVRSAQDEHQPEARKKLARRLAAQDRHHRAGLRHPLLHLASGCGCCCMPRPCSTARKALPRPLRSPMTITTASPHGSTRFMRDAPRAPNRTT